MINLNSIDRKRVEDDLSTILEDSRGKLEEIKIDNPDYDPEFAKIGKEDSEIKRADGDTTDAGSTNDDTEAIGDTGEPDWSSGSEDEEEIESKQTTLF